MARRSGLEYHLKRVFVMQVFLISLATILGVWATAKIIEQVLVKQALVKEAEYFWDLYQRNPDQPRPHTRHMEGLLQVPQGGDMVPPELTALPDGFQRVPYQGRTPILYINTSPQGRLFLIFDEQRVAVLALLFGVLPLSGVLLVIYLSAFQTWRRSRKLMSPLVQLAEILRRVPVTDPQAARPDLSEVEAEADSEVAVLVSSLEAYADRLLDYVGRERQFTRDASHELRTPLAVIRANLTLLASPARSEAAMRRIDDTVEDMESLIETLLLLSRSEHTALPTESLVVNDLVINLVERLQPLAERKGVALRVEQKALLSLNIVEVMLTIVLTNLVRNAINYTSSGQIVVSIHPDALLVTDSGKGMTEEELQRLFKPFERGDSNEPGHGLGLAIVQRLCELNKWQVEVASAPGEGTQVKVVFPSWQKD